MTIYDQLSKAVAEATPREVQPRVSSPTTSQLKVTEYEMLLLLV